MSCLQFGRGRAGAGRGQGIFKRAIVALKWAIRALLGAARSLKLAFGNLKLLLGTLKSALGTIKITLGTIKRGLETLTMVRWILKGAQETRKWDPSALKLVIWARKWAIGFSSKPLSLTLGPSIQVILIVVPQFCDSKPVHSSSKIKNWQLIHNLRR